MTAVSDFDLTYWSMHEALQRRILVRLASFSGARAT
jgi:hypothetical protein